MGGGCDCSVEWIHFLRQSARLWVCFRCRLVLWTARPELQRLGLEVSGCPHRAGQIDRRKKAKRCAHEVVFEYVGRGEAGYAFCIGRSVLDDGREL